MNAKKILIAEDDVDLLHSIGRCLARAGYVVICVEDGYQALDYAMRERPDLFLLDVHMPCGDGFSVHERLLRRPELVATPVIFMSRQRNAAMEAEAVDHGATAFLHKPFEMDEMLEAVRGAFSDPESEAA